MDVMTDEEGEEDFSLILLLAGLLPLNIDQTRLSLERLYLDVLETKWLELFHRIANIGFVLAIVGLVGLSALLLSPENTPNIPIPLGVTEIAGGGLIFLIVLGKLVVKTSQSINRAYPLLGSVPVTKLSASLELALGISLLSAIAAILYNNDTMLVGIALIGTFFMGSFITGAFLLLGGAAFFIKRRTDTEGYE